MAISDKIKRTLNTVVQGAKLGDIIQSAQTDLTNIRAPFVSTEQTGNGSAQNIAHGLATTPSNWLVEVTAVASGANTFVKGTADGTNCPVTATTGSKYRVWAWK